MIQRCPKCQKLNPLYKEGYSCSYCGYRKITERDKRGNIIDDPETKKLKEKIIELEKEIILLKKENEILKNNKK